MKKKKKLQIDIDDGNKDKYGNDINLKNFGYQTCGSFNTIKKNFNTLDDNKKEDCNEINYKRENSYGDKIFKNYKTLESMPSVTYIPGGSVENTARVLSWCLNIHGHDHNGSEPYAKGCKHLNLAANVCGFTPVSLGKLIKDGILSDIDSIHRQTIDSATERKKLKELY